MTAALAASRERERLEIQHQPIGIAERVIRGAQGHRNPIDASHSVGHLPRRARRHPYASSDRPRAVHPVLGFGAHRGDGQGRGSRQAVLRDREEPARRSRARGSRGRLGGHHVRHGVVLHQDARRGGLPRIPSRGRAAGSVHSLHAVRFHGEARGARGVEGRAPRHTHGRADHARGHHAQDGGHRLVSPRHHRSRASRIQRRGVPGGHRGIVLAGDIFAAALGGRPQAGAG